MINYNVFAGIGVGFLHTPSISAVSEYFSKHRAMAMGIGATGSSVGQLVLPHLMRFLLDRYGYISCMLIYGTFTWNTFVSSALLRSPKFYGQWQKPDLLMSVRKRRTDNDNETEVIQLQEVTDMQPTSSEGAAVVDMPGRMEEPPTHDEATRRHTINLASPVLSPIIPRLRSETNAVFFGSGRKLNVLTEPTCSKPDEADTSCCKNSCYGLKSLWDPIIVCNPVIWVYSAAIFLGSSSILNMIFFLPSYCKEIHLSKMQASVIVSVGGIADLVFKILGGIFNNYHLMKARHYLTISLLTMAIVILICTFVPCFASLMVMTVMLGGLGGMYTGMYPVHLLEMVGHDRFPIAFGFASGLYAIIHLFVPVIGGMRCFCSLIDIELFTSYYCIYLFRTFQVHNNVNIGSECK